MSAASRCFPTGPFRCGCCSTPATALRSGSCASSSGIEPAPVTAFRNHSLTGGAIWFTPGIPLMAGVPQGRTMFRIDFNKLRFLVCDDNPHMRRILRTLLHSFGAREVYESEDGATALEMYSHYVPDIVITDWSMPIFDGLELAQMIRQPESKGNPYAPIIMLTGHSEKRRVTVARDGGEMEVMQQPSLLDKARSSI